MKKRTQSLPYFDSPVTFIDNSDNHVVIEYEEEFAEKWLMDEVYRDDSAEAVGKVWNARILQHVGLGPGWDVTRIEYTGSSYIVTFDKNEWV